MTAVLQLLLAFAFVGIPPFLLAHAPHQAGQSMPNWNRWEWNWLVLTNLAFATALYGRGARTLWTRAGTGRGGISIRQVCFFGTGILVLFIALVSPIATAADELQWVHMVQHMLIMMVAAPLLVLASPGAAVLWVLPRSWRQRLGRWWNAQSGFRLPWYWLWQPAALWVVYAATLWIWHLPSLYQAALHNDLLHDFQHLSFLLVSCLFWRLLLDPISRMRLNRGLGVLYLFGTTLHAMLLGVFMALSPRLWYPAYDGRVQVWNMNPLDDQQIAGLIMWMPACTIYAVAAALLFARWLRESSAADEVKGLQEDT